MSLQALLFIINDRRNIYHFSQVNFAYNSNKIEGGRLIEDETEEKFETNSFIPKKREAVKFDDLTDLLQCYNALK